MIIKLIILNIKTVSYNAKQSEFFSAVEDRNLAYNTFLLTCTYCNCCHIHINEFFLISVNQNLYFTISE